MVEGSETGSLPFKIQKMGYFEGQNGLSEVKNHEKINRKESF